MARRRNTGIVTLIAILFSLSASAQMEDWVQTFKDTRVINGHSVETNFKGGMKFIISHRFGPLNGGTYELFGLDQSTIRIGLDYGITDRLTIGAGRSSLGKHYDGFVKYRLLIQKENGTPVSVTALSNMAINTLRWENPDRENFTTSRFFYTWQLMVAKRFNDDFALQIMPTLVHRNLVPNRDVAHDVFSIGASARYQLTKHLALQFEGYFIPEDQLAQEFEMPLSIGVDIETKGHQFQLSLSNSMGMTEKIFITETRGSWLDGGFGIGFNITRDFRIRGRK
ncbi:DUF5777 family beta-barrel protein [Sanyastnella coralliicola]|uniref:DUF5777 family beta-barrel protein n=1 Tax=Sanyastnella coralliicola TaxID=3069118 RepID=UPI0027BA4CE3|nr:DUF5777 family beta-barrel protein [Longitalea sp. SCSIO 12813]